MLLTVFISKFATKIPLPSPLLPTSPSPLPLKILIQEFKDRKMKLCLKEFKKGRSLDHNNRLKGLGHHTDGVLVVAYMDRFTRRPKEGSRMVFTFFRASFHYSLK
jgi:hypothetical protein